MKYFILLILLTGYLSHAQKDYPDYTRVTYYTLVSEYDDGPCNIKSYVEEGVVGSLVQGIDSFDAALATKLLLIKKESQNWKYKGFWCDRKCIGCETIPNMFIIEINSKYDTIYTTANNKHIFDPKLQRVYFDTNQKLLTALPKDFIAFSKNSFYEELRRPTLDSVAVGKVLFYNKPVYNYTCNDFKQEIGKFDFVKSDSAVGREEHNDRDYHFKNANFKFDDNTKKLKEFTETESGYSNKESGTGFCGISIGAKEDTVIKTFPLSSRYKRYVLPRFSLDELKDDYFYEVRLSGAGYINLYIKEKRIYKIEAYFYYQK